MCGQGANEEIRLASRFLWAQIEPVQWCYWSVRFWFIDWCCCCFLHSRTFFHLNRNWVSAQDWDCLSVLFIHLSPWWTQLSVWDCQLANFICLPRLWSQIFSQLKLIEQIKCFKASKKTTAFFFTVYNCTVLWGNIVQRQHWAQSVSPSPPSPLVVSAVLCFSGGHILSFFSTTNEGKREREDTLTLTQCCCNISWPFQLSFSVCLLCLSVSV